MLTNAHMVIDINQEIQRPQYGSRAPTQLIVLTEDFVTLHVTYSFRSNTQTSNTETIYDKLDSECIFSKLLHSFALLNPQV